MSRVVTVTGKAVKFPYNYKLKLFARTIFYHLLKVRTVIRSGGESTVNICTNYLNIVLFSKSLAFTQLPFNRLFALIIT